MLETDGSDVRYWRSTLMLLVVSGAKLQKKQEMRFE